MAYQLCAYGPSETFGLERLGGVVVKDNGADLGEVRIDATQDGPQTSVRIGTVWVELQGELTKKGKRIRRPTWYQAAVKRAHVLTQGAT